MVLTVLGFSAVVLLFLPFDDRYIPLMVFLAGELFAPLPLFKDLFGLDELFWFLITCAGYWRNGSHPGKRAQGMCSLWPPRCYHFATTLG